MLTGAQVMVKCLEAEGIKAVFGYPGVAICPFYDSLYDSGIRNILVRQEWRSYGQRLCPGDEEAGGLCGNFGTGGNESDHSTGNSLC